GARYEAYGWQHILVKDGRNLNAISAAIEAAKQEKNKPTLIEVKTVIGFGAPNQGTSSVHGAPLGIEGIQAAKGIYGWDYPEFEVPEEVATRFKETMIEEGQKAEEEWNELFARYEGAYPELAAQFRQAFSDELPEEWADNLPTFEVGS
ncbi:MAG TPA: transketolase, partial [Enterococcus aquimarinus]|nr:transketolase [Enterococcus aquimarinus]